MINEANDSHVDTFREHPLILVSTQVGVGLAIVLALVPNLSPFGGI